MDIPFENLKTLRALMVHHRRSSQTSIIDCKRALEASGGDVGKAFYILYRFYPDGFEPEYEEVRETNIGSGPPPRGFCGVG